MITQQTLAFFRELRQNNNKEWFDKNRHRYETVKKEYHALTRALLEEMQQHDKYLAHLQLKDCTFRINRDIRFAKDKSPYKTNLGIILTPHGHKLQFAGYYVHLDEDPGSFAGGGLYMPPADVLKKVRTEISNFPEDLEEILAHKNFLSTYGSMDQSDGIKLTRPPKGFQAEEKVMEYLKLKSFIASRNIEIDMLTKEEGIREVAQILRKLTPLIGFLNRALQNNP